MKVWYNSYILLIKYIFMKTENILSFLKTQYIYDSKVNELSIELNEIANEYPNSMWWVNDEGRKLDRYKKAKIEYNHYFRELRKFNSLDNSKKAIKSMGKLGFMERRELRESIK